MANNYFDKKYSIRSKTYHFFKIVFTFFLSCFVFLAFTQVNVYQPMNLNSDGSGSIKVTYYTKELNLVKNNYELGEYSFKESKLRKNFTSSNTEIKTFLLSQTLHDSMTYAIVDINFKDINKLSDAKGFSNIKASWEKTDTGMVFKLILLKNPEYLNFISTLFYVVTFEDSIKSTNGFIDKNTVTWGGSIKDIDFSKDVIFTATIKKTKSSCGLIGIEFPFMFFLGLLLSNFSTFKRRVIRRVYRT